MSRSNTQLKFVAPLKKFQIHHAFPFGNWVLCNGSREGIPLDNFFDKKPKKCGQCDRFKGKDQTCRVGYYVSSADMKSCKQAIKRGIQRSY